MKAFLQASGLWRIVNGTNTRPAAAGPDQLAWDVSDDMALGHLTLRMSHNIRNHVGASSAATWTALQTAYGAVGVSRIYGDFKALVSFKFSVSQNPQAEIERFNVHERRLAAQQVIIPNAIQAMLLLAALPAKWDHIAAIYLQGKQIANVDPIEVRQAIVAEFDRTNSGGQQHAHRISAIKRKGEHPKWKGKAPANKSSPAEGEQRPDSSSKKRTRTRKPKGKGQAYNVDRSPSPNPFTLAAPAIVEPARPQIVLQQSRAPLNKPHVVASYNSHGVTYSSVAASGGGRFSGIPPVPGPSTMQRERALLQRMNVRPTTEPLKSLGALKKHADFMAKSPAVQAAVAATEPQQPVASSSSRTLDDIVPTPPLVDFRTLKFGSKRKVRKTLLARMGLPKINQQGTRKRQQPLTPSTIVEVSDEDDDRSPEDVYDELFGGNNLDDEIAESAGLCPVSAIQIDDDGCGSVGVFDDHYDPRQVIHSNINRIHTNDGNALQHHLYVACNSSSKLKIGEVYDKVLTSDKISTVNCAKCENNIKFIADTGASDTFTYDKSDFVTFTKMDGRVKTANEKASLDIQGYGTVFIKHTILVNEREYSVTTKLSPVYYAPGMAYRLISIGSLLQKGYRLYGDKRKMLIRKPDNTTVMAFHPHALDPSIYWLSAQLVKSTSALSALVMNLQGHELWHQRLGHPSSDVLRQVSKHTTGTPVRLEIPQRLPICRGCAQGKMTSSSFPDSSSRAEEPFALIHSDLKTIPVLSYHKYKYILTFFDDHTSHGWITFLKDKASTYQAWLNFIAMVKTQYKKDVAGIMSDMGGEFTSLKLTEKLKELGIKIYRSVPHMAQQNGRAERFNRTLFEKSEAMRHHACLPKSWWEFCVKYAVHVYNRTPLQRHKFKSPFESLNKEKPDLSHLRTMGCSAYVFLHEDQRQDKLSPHAELMTFIGMTDGVKGWKFMRSTQRIFHATKAVFDESTFLHCPEEGSRASIPGIETGLLPIDEQNIPPEDDHHDLPRPPPPVESDAIWRPRAPYPYVPRHYGNNNDDDQPPYNYPPLPPSTPSTPS